MKCDLKCVGDSFAMFDASPSEILEWLNVIYIHSVKYFRGVRKITKSWDLYGRSDKVPVVWSRCLLFQEFNSTDPNMFHTL